MGHLDRLATLQKGGVAWPINIEVDLSNRCSLGCEWCHFAFTHTRGPLAKKRQKPEGAIPGGDLMDTELALDLIEQIGYVNELGAGISITWTGGGEPTLHPDFTEIIEHAYILGIPQGIYTHGGHITRELAISLKTTMRFVYVSLDATNAPDYKRLKGVDRFEKACEGVRNLHGAPGDATVGLGMLVGAHTHLEDIADAYALSQQLGADYVQYRPIISFHMETPDQPSDDRSWINPLIAEMERFPDATWDRGRFEMLRDWNGHSYQTCWWSALQTVITPNGMVWTCVNKREHPAALIGDLTLQDFSAMWLKRPLAKVDGTCRVMCRGHIPNLTLNEIMTSQPHPEFV